MALATKILRRTVRLLLWLGGALAALTASVLLLFSVYITRDFPDAGLLRSPSGLSGLMAGSAYAGGDFSPEKFQPLRYEELPPHVVNAFLAAWDNKFFTDRRFWKGVGCEVIFPDLARCLIPPKQGWERRTRNPLFALYLEMRLSKEEIFCAWLNTLRFADGVYGVEAASRLYFAKPLRELSVAEAAFLSGLPHSPGSLTLDAARHRQGYVLDYMLKLGLISKEEHAAALAQPTVPADSSALKGPARIPQTGR